MAKNLEELTDQAIAVINIACNYPKFTRIERPLTINYRAKSRWGYCTKDEHLNYSVIEISSRILDDAVPDEATLSTIIHELLHAIKGTHGHTGLWKKYASMVNYYYPEYKITRTANADFFGLEDDRRPINRKYAIKCTHCGYTHRSSKLSRTIKHPEYYRCSCCGGKLIRIK